jgi:glutamate synthase (NADPH/NADH) small chain
MEGHLVGIEVREARRSGARDKASEAVGAGNRQIAANLVIEAIGFEPEDFPRLFQCPDLKIRNNGTLEVTKGTYETSLPGVFAAGDIVRGASLAVWAVREGQDAAAAIHRHLRAATGGSKPAFRDRSIIHFGAERLSRQPGLSRLPESASIDPTA